MNLKELDHYLIGEAWTSTEAYTNLERLCDIGSRFAGSAGGRAARDLILDKFNAYGLSNAHTEPFDFLVWTRGECELKLLAPQQRTLRSAISLVYSPNADHIRAELMDCGIGSEQDFAKHPYGARRGKIAMVTTANPERGPSIHRREKYGRAVAAGAIGFVYVNHKPGMLAETGSLRPGRLAEIPAVGISYEEGWELARQARRGNVEVEMTVHNGTQMGQGFHVLGEIEGQANETIIVGAHYDGHDISQGARDDGTGTVVVLELARILAPLKGQLKRTIRLIAFDAEELGVLGSSDYVKAHLSDMGNVALMVNLDGAAGPVDTHGFLTGGFKDTENVIRKYAKSFGYPLALRDRVVTASDNFPFFMQGVPAICMTARNENPALGRGFGHTAADTLDKVAEVELKQAAMTMARMLARLANHDGSLGARKSRDEIKQVLLDQDLERPLRAQDKWPF
ncbi:MAG: M28 family peptidase [Chloroflexi bacterium]|nr:M28 family peptidase [Chloroflexota bacterium]